MEASPKQQVVELINAARQILLIPSRLDGDSLGSALGLFRVLRKLGKQPTLLATESVPDSYRFLPHVPDIKPNIDGGRDFVISLTQTEVETDKLSYNFDGGRLNIIISTKTGQFTPEDVEFKAGGPAFDLAIVLDASSLEHLGEVYTTHKEALDKIPMVNIDHHATNTYFGKVNLVNMTAASTAEILVGLIEALGQDLLDSDVATCLLTGMVSDTGSFQHSNTTPKALTVAAQMVGYGARHQEIVKQLFKTKSLGAVQLWGRVLSRVEYDAAGHLSWSWAALSDLAETGATEQDFSGVAESFLTSIPDVDIGALITEREGYIKCSLRAAHSEVNVNDIASLFGGGGHAGAAGFKLVGKDLDSAKTEILQSLRDYQSRRLNPNAVAPAQEKEAPILENMVS